ncbi:uncharacterized protein LOC131846175 [Achroia grisella]|uniref:uncharacterized protein LOC131846175 n=1 Tax=Achroia grisella TaxID=688607 RepID=UPI0027D27E71|nr:uncharacterized protein LOC131846175 [Achroia grisella]
MDSNLDKSLSDTEMHRVGQANLTPPNFVTSRSKRKRDDDYGSEISKLREEMQSMFTKIMTSQEKEFKKNAATLKEIQFSSANIEQSVTFLSAQNEEYRKKIELLENKMKEDRKYITILEDKLENMHQDSRKANFEIKNVPKKQNETKEDLISMVTYLSNTVGCQIDKSAIRDVYRVRPKKETVKNTPIVVETSSTLLKNEILKSCKAHNIKHKTKLCAKNLGFRTSEHTPVFVTEHLTAKAARLYFLARDLVKSKSYKFCWTAYGKVYVRKEDNSPVISIRTESQIEQLISNI